MVFKRLNIDQFERTVSYEPPARTDFKPFIMSVPDMEIDTEKDLFRDALKSRVGESCGNTTCKGTVSLVFNRTFPDPQSELGLGGAITLESGLVQCDSQECPLGRQGGSGDREPRNPIPEPPALQAEAPIPVNS